MTSRCGAEPGAAARSIVHPTHGSEPNPRSRDDPVRPSPRTIAISEKPRRRVVRQHGATPRRKVSEYKKQLVERQRLRAQYNVSERQLRRRFLDAVGVV